jgi:hypothetical protein
VLCSGLDPVEEENITRRKRREVWSKSFQEYRRYHNNKMPFSVPKASVTVKRLSSCSKKQEVIDLLDSDDDEHTTIEMKKSSVASPVDVTVTPKKQSLSMHQQQQQRRRPQQQPEIVDLLDTKPAARKDLDGDLDRKFSPQKRRRTDCSNAVVSHNDKKIVENLLDGKPKAAPDAELPGFVKVGSPKEISPLMKVLEVFPDVAVNHVKKLLTQNNGNPESVVAAILSDENYPKEQSAVTDGTATAGPLLLRRSSSIVVERLRTQPKYDYSSPTAFQSTYCYFEEAIQQLAHLFPFLRIPTVRSVFQNNHCKYTLARRHIHDAIVGKVNKLSVLPVDQLLIVKNNEGPANAQKPVNEMDEKHHFQVLKAALLRGNISKASMQRLGVNVCVRRPRKTNRTTKPTISDDILRDEIHHFEEELQEWEEKIQKRLRREAARKMSLENGSFVLCECCFENVAASECLPCKDNGVSTLLLLACTCFFLREANVS